MHLNVFFSHHVVKKDSENQIESLESQIWYVEMDEGHSSQIK